MQISGFQSVLANNEVALLEAVSRQPISVAMDGSGAGFYHYSSGVFDAPDCEISTSHAVTLVGYGTSPEGIKYWLAKNSWGETWGENGYIRIRRDVEWPQGMCGVAQYCFYPVA
uniref:Vignain n=1 Tax=Noccaea caerulescens TaxID=107243 RepID=A0A1J3D4G5_NOCCA